MLPCTTPSDPLVGCLPLPRVCRTAGLFKIRFMCHENYKIPNMFQSDMFLQTENTPKPFSARASPRTQLRSLRRSPRR